MTRKTNRRNFLIGSVAAATAIGSQALSKKTTFASSSTIKSMPARILGKTQISLPVLGLGGAGQTPISYEGKEKEAIALIEKALELGIKYYDTAASYGPSEERFGKILPTYRDRIYLNSKTASRDYDGAWRELELSLKRLQTDYLDSWQLHHVSFTDELDIIFSNQGAIKAVEEAKEQGLIKFSGITGHHEPEVIAEGLRRYDFDTTLISLNAADVHHPRPFSRTVLPVAQAKNVGVIAMKVPAYGKLLQPGILSSMEQAMGYSLSLPGVHCCIIAAENPEQLEANVTVARNYTLLNTAQMTQIEQLTINAGEDGAFFRRWT
ncbi:aldo/keto reductase [Pleurocapsa sp. CCALA 161]|uniref:aldo/keto reductase n=1 Tax=Pleurocapsa sp. CCALA 161 TaxID=2107688 RepID=UPI000D078F5D|nr:aldo/keto reductase [Pleurocapsa sp. CCALA 161]PSB07767.1 aldo/keto reductase [Pleurocapsa sp. CCALA 161]